MVRWIVFFVLTAVLACGTVQAQDSGFGLGVILGEPTGISGKLWIEDSKAIDGAVAWSFDDESAMHLHADLLFHSSNISKVEMSKLLLYYGIGGRIKFEEDSKAGVRVPLGINYIPSKGPLDVFLEIVPILDLAPSTDFGLSGAIGIRYFFRHDNHR
ncbi:MAG: hypothetical protein AMJ89_06065 [candidate division Zixibacteria bacterium SM23_73]|nr:MAG: hypothetical protein AMJ89_06065 [candidate division Zixibacteria bacterium SM23_73]